MLLKDQIRVGRERLGWSQDKLADMVGSHVSAVGHWESGRHEPGPYFLLKLQSLGVLPAGPPVERRKRVDEQGTYFVPSSQSHDETMRLHMQAQATTSKLGGPLPEQADPTRFHRVLDVGCGTGDWLIELAETYPEMELVGIDRSAQVLDFARAQAKRAGVSERIRFERMDAQQGLVFQDLSFDLVNLRFGMSWLRTWDWPNLLNEMRRVLKIGGTVRLVETLLLESNTPAFNHFWYLGIKGARQSGHITDDIESVAELFPQFLDAAGFSHVQLRQTDALYVPGTPEFLLFVEDMRFLLAHSESHLARWLHVSDYQKLVASVERELAEPDFSLTWKMLAAWDEKMD